MLMRCCRMQDAELSPADLHALAAAQLDAWRAAHSDAEGFEARGFANTDCEASARGRALHMRAADWHARRLQAAAPINHPIQ